MSLRDEIIEALALPARDLGDQADAVLGRLRGKGTPIFRARWYNRYRGWRVKDYRRRDKAECKARLEPWQTVTPPCPHPRLQELTLLDLGEG